jgi:hypothetical protein
VQRIKLARAMGKVLVDTGFACWFLSTRTFVPTPFAPVFVSCAIIISPSPPWSIEELDAWRPD